MSIINPGDVVTVRTDPPFTVNGVATDPTAVYLIWRRKGGPPTMWIYGVDSEIVRDSVGTFHADIAILRAGTYYFRWEGTGAVRAAEENTFEAVTNFPS